MQVNAILRGMSALLLLVPGALVAGELTPLRYEPLPAGSITAEGWLGVQLGQMTEGLVGRLYEESEFLKPDNAWLDRNGTVGWEEQAYWLRSFVKIAILTRNERMLKESARWMETLAANADADGWYGPQTLKSGRNAAGKILSDIWPHMVMNEAILTWWEHTGDRRWLELVHRFMSWCQRQDDVRLIPPYDEQKGLPSIDKAHYGNWTWCIQVGRAGDMLPAIYRVYDATGDADLLRLARRVYMKRERARLFLNEHNVNFSQLFTYGTVFGRQSKAASDLGYADHWYDLHQLAWGAMIPRQGFASDENVRIGCYDPRYGTETCTWAEFVRSYSLLGSQTGDPKWADRAEDVVFNWCPISYTPGWKELHYVTAANQVSQDAQHDHDYANCGPMVAYSAKTYRCCRHNAALALPEFAQHLVMRDGDGLVFWAYAPHSGKAKIGGRTVTWKMTTRYPFEERIDLVVTGAEGLKLSFRVPGWVEAVGWPPRMCVSASGGMSESAFTPGRVRELPASPNGRWTIAFRSSPRFRSVVRTGAVMVEKGPLTYSVAIEPEMRRIRRPQTDWTSGEMKIKYDENAKPLCTDEEMVEIVPAKGARWSFALETGVAPEFRALPWKDDCFTFANAPCELTVAARELKEWTLQDAQPARLQESPALTTAPVEKVRFIPMACARSHVTVFPTATTNAEAGCRWKTVPASTLRKDRAKVITL